MLAASGLDCKQILLRSENKDDCAFILLAFKYINIRHKKHTKAEAL